VFGVDDLDREQLRPAPETDKDIDPEVDVALIVSEAIELAFAHDDKRTVREGKLKASRAELDRGFD